MMEIDVPTSAYMCVCVCAYIDACWANKKREKVMQYASHTPN